ncbi:hypothetical protein D1007_20436 [Hordeum vulgare]|nr:hypothetical protein D1007_20436 [Hordeum vulgare]
MTLVAGGLASAPAVNPRAPLLQLSNVARSKKGKVSGKKKKAADGSGSSKPSRKRLPGGIGGMRGGGIGGMGGMDGLRAPPGGIGGMGEEEEESASDDESEEDEDEDEDEDEA